MLQCVLLGVGMALDGITVMVISQAVHAAGCGPQVFAAFTNGLCYAFTPGVPLTIQDMTQERVWQANARQMATFHKIQVKHLQYIFLKLCKDAYVRLCSSNNSSSCSSSSSSSSNTVQQQH